MCHTLPEEAVKAAAIKLIERMAFGYEVMFEKLCHISGTSGADQSWYRAKAREATERLSPLHSITTESNKSVPGDCKRQYQDFMSRILSALEPSAARELALGILPCWMCGADEASTYLGEPGPGAVKCFAVSCDAEISGFPSDKEAIAEWNRRSLAMDAAMTEAYCTSDENDLTECFQHHIRTSIGWQAFGARPGKELQMYEEGFKAGYRRCKSDNEPELGEEEELSQRARKLVGRLRESIKAGAVNLSDVEDAVDLILDQDARALSSPDHADAGKVEGDGCIGEWKEIEVSHPLKGRRQTPAYFPATGETCEVSGPNCDDDDGFTWGKTTVLWQNQLFVLYGNDGYWPVLHKHEHVLFRPLPSAPASEGAE